jgi:hypothetical protein
MGLHGDKKKIWNADSFRSQPLQQQVHIALTAVATVYTGKSKFRNISGCSLFGPETKNDCDGEGQ